MFNCIPKTGATPLLQFFISPFSSTYSPMWSHYGDNHSGVVLKFATEHDILFKKNIWPVIYSEKLLEAKERTDFFKCLLTKLNVWKVEEEWRIISEKRKFGFNQKALVEIVFGLKVTDETIKWFKLFRENVYYMHAPIYKLKLKGNQIFKVDEDGEATLYENDHGN